MECDGVFLERVTGIGPARPAWKAGILPLNYTRTAHFIAQNNVHGQTAYKPYAVYPKNASLLSVVEHLSKLALLSRCVILVQNTLVDSTVDHADCVEVGLGSKLLVTFSKCSLILLDRSLHCGTEALVLKSLGFGNENALLCRFNIRQTTHLLLLIFGTYLY